MSRTKITLDTGAAGMVGAGGLHVAWTTFGRSQGNNLVMRLFPFLPWLWYSLLARHGVAS